MRKSRLQNRPTPVQQWAQEQLQVLQAELKFMQRHHRGWDRAWEAIKTRFGDYDCKCPETGQMWQYLGTSFGQHEFRHRYLPSRGERTYYKVPVEEGDWDVIREPVKVEEGLTMTLRRVRPLS